MKLSERGQSAVAAMIDLALHGPGGPVVLAAIAQRQAIALGTLERLFTALRRHELVASVRGKYGGYQLGRSAARITVADVVAAVDPSVVAIGCGGKGDCMGPWTGHCATHDLWLELNTKLAEYLATISLQDLVDDRCAATLPLAAAEALAA